MRRSGGPKTENGKSVARTPFGLADATTEDKLRQEEEDEERKDASPGSMGLKRKLSFDEVTPVCCCRRQEAVAFFVLVAPFHSENLREQEEARTKKRAASPSLDSDKDLVPDR
jgi:hypothetical protein